MRRSPNAPADSATAIQRRFHELWSGADHLSGEQQWLLWESTGYRDWVIDLIDDYQGNSSLNEHGRQFACLARRQAKDGHARHALLTLRLAMHAR
jgi:hypothetical protein